MRGLTSIIALALTTFLLTGCGGQPTKAATPGLETRVFSSGAVEVTVEPVALNSSGAKFKVGLNTHSGDLGADLAKTSTLEVDGRTWSGASWTGDGPGGHHRQGELRFQAGGPAAGDVRLAIGGLPAAVVATWTLPATK